MDRNTLYILSKTDDPSFNLATEELLLRHYKENIIFLYINKPSVIVGKHQNTLSEINLSFLEQNHIPVYRRLSGGGTVYHDHGNINYCIIENGQPGQLVDFVRASTPVVEALKNMGIDARHGKRNDLLYGFKKISGNACHVYKSRSMHHGTLLYKTNLQHLTESLKTNGINFKDRSVKSVRSEVLNISGLIGSNKTPTEFMAQMGEHLRQKYNAAPLTLSEEDFKRIEQLKKEKYDTWEWNYGYSPIYEFKKRSKINDYTFSSKIKVEKGIITQINIRSNFPDKDKIHAAETTIHSAYHDKKQIQSLLSDFPKDITEGIINVLF